MIFHNNVEYPHGYEVFTNTSETSCYRFDGSLPSADEGVSDLALRSDGGGPAPPAARRVHCAASVFILGLVLVVVLLLGLGVGLDGVAARAAHEARRGRRRRGRAGCAAASSQPQPRAAAARRRILRVLPRALRRAQGAPRTAEASALRCGQRELPTSRRFSCDAAAVSARSRTRRRGSSALFRSRAAASCCCGSGRTGAQCVARKAEAEAHRVAC
mgnify:CR=1 FL=1